MAADPGTIRSELSTPPVESLPQDELENLAEDLGLEPRAHKSRQHLLAAIGERRQLIAAMQREALLDVIRWGRRPVPVDATKERLAGEISRIKSQRLEGLSERGLVALAVLRGVNVTEGDNAASLKKKLSKREGVFGWFARKRRAWLGKLVSNMIGEGQQPQEYQFLPPQQSGQSEPSGEASAAGPTIQQEIEEEGLLGGLASRIKRSADSYLNQKLDEIESRIDRKLDEIDRRLGEWRDKEVASRLKILKITLWVSVIVAALALVYMYAKVYLIK